MVGAEDVICSDENEAELKCSKVRSFFLSNSIPVIYLFTLLFFHLLFYTESSGYFS